MAILIKSAHVVDPQNGLDGVCDVLIDKQVITKIGKNISGKKYSCCKFKK